MTPLGWLNAIMPKDPGSRRVGRGLRYGPHERHRFDLYAPERGGQPRGVIIFILGGGWHSGNCSDYEFAGRALAGRGFLTMVPEYRNVPEVHFPAFVEDCGLAGTWAMEHAAEYGGDPSRFVLGGHSAGAYNAAMLGLDPARFGAPRLAGRVRGIVGLSGPYDFYPFDVKESIDAFARAEDPESTQPVNLVTPGAPPMFLAHGDRDRICGPYNTINLAAKLREAGVPVTELHEPRFAHAGPLLTMMPLLRFRSTIWPKLAAFLSAC